MTIRLQGKEYVTHVELVQWASEAGLASVSVETLHLDIEKQECIMRATATGERGTYQGTGDVLGSVSGNISNNMLPSFIRMAETRAVNRALRLYTGRASTSFDELGEVPSSQSQRRPRQDGEPPRHHPSWERHRARFCAKLGDMGLDYELIASWCDDQGWGRPSTWATDDDREQLLADLGSRKVRP